MTKKLINEMVQASLTKNKIDGAKVDEIARHLKRNELKSYLRALKIYNNKNSITIITARPVGKDVQKDLASKFDKKEINYEIDSEKLFGVEIIDGDMIYDNTLRRTFDEVISFVKN